MDAAPTHIGGAKVIAYSPIDQRHRATYACKHTVGGIVQRSFAGLLISRYEGEDGCYLFYCDEKWNAITDTWHLSVADAMKQAEFEYENMSATWNYYKE